MGNFKCLALLALLLSISLVVLADTSTDATHAKDEVKPQATEAETKAENGVVQPQQFQFCRFGCCGSMFFAQCNLCCPNAQAAEAFKVKASETDTVEPQQRWRGPCRFGCCGSYAFGQCSACCPRKMGVEEEKKKEEAKP